MMDLLQKTIAGFSKSGSRRMDAEFCLIDLCRPELNLDAQAINARLTSLEEKIASGQIAIAAAPAQNTTSSAVQQPKPAAVQAKPEPTKKLVNDAPKGFETDLFSELKKEGSGADFGWFSAENVKVILQGDVLFLRCANAFVLEAINRPELLSKVSAKASGLLKRNVRVAAINKEDQKNNDKLRSIMQFGKDNPDIVRIKS